MDAALDPSLAEQYFANSEEDALNQKASDDPENLNSDEPNNSNDNLYESETPSQKLKFKVKKGPTAFILTIILSLFGLGIGAGFAFPFAFAARVSEEFNSIASSSSIRGNFFMRKLFKNGLSNTKAKTSNSLADNIMSDNQFKLSNKQKKKLAKYDIEYDSNSKTLKYKGESITPDGLKSKLDTDIEFRTKFTDAGQTWKGKASGWFDKTVNKVLDRLGVKGLRNKFKNFKNTGNKAADTDSFRTKAPKNATADASAKTRTVKEELELDANGKPIPDANGNPKTKKSIVDISDEINTPSALKSKFNEVANKAGSMINIYCGIMAGANAIQLLVSTNQAMETINLVAGFLEATQKVMAGDGDTSPLSNYMEDITTPDKDGKTALESYGVHSLFSGGGSNFSAPAEKNSDPRRSNGFLLSNRESFINSLPLSKSIGNMKDTIKQCSMLKTAAAVTSLAVTIAGIFSGGIATAVTNVTKEAVFKQIFTLVASVAITKAAELAIQTIATSYMSKLNYLGDAGGNALGSGANMYPSENAKGGGQSPASTEKVLAYRREVLAKYQAETRAHDIASKSSFDLSSPYTFAGTIARSLATFSVNNSKLTNSFARIGNMTVNSIASILPSADAIGETKFLTTKGHCPMLEQLGVHADPYCNPYYITDPSTIGANHSPKDIFDIVYGARTQSKYDKNRKTCKNWSWSSNFLYNSSTENPANEDLDSSCRMKPKVDEYNNPIINPHSYLGGYIRFCGHRGSQLGINDANILSWAKHTNFANGTFDSAGKTTSDASASPILGMVPILGDVLDLVDSITDNDDEAINFANGQYCVASSENPYWESEFKYYQRYIEDQRWMENAGIISKSAADLVMDNQLAMQPLDNSYEGVLARYSGMNKSAVLATLNYIEYQKFIAKYHPTDSPAPTKYPESPISYVNSRKSQNHELTEENTLVHILKNAKTTLLPLTKKTRYAIMV